jgi:uncharacterized protein YndB with AHSA1/START domain
VSAKNIPPTGHAKTGKRLFSRETSVTAGIAATPETIWGLLTNADKFPDWNSTIVQLTGKIAPGETIILCSTLAPERTFKLKVKEFEPCKKLSSCDAMGTVFTRWHLDRAVIHCSQ